MNDIVRPLYWFFLIISGGGGGLLWRLTFVPAKDSKSLIGQIQLMMRFDGVWKFISYIGLVMSAVIFFCSLVSLLATL